MLLVDSTVWISYFNGQKTAETDYLDHKLSSRLILVGDLILAEVLQGFRTDADFELARVHLGRFLQRSMLNPSMAIISARNYRHLRQRGITIGKTIDCIIATYAIENGYELLHSDRDFDPFERYLELRVVHP